MTGFCPMDLSVIVSDFPEDMLKQSLLACVEFFDYSASYPDSFMYFRNTSLHLLPGILFLEILPCVPDISSFVQGFKRLFNTLFQILNL